MLQTSVYKQNLRKFGVNPGIFPANNRAVATRNSRAQIELFCLHILKELTETVAQQQGNLGPHNSHF